ncbi:hypothetical protein CPB84DRAFT_1803568, partial [Gymnopilus junonius]
MLSDKQTEQGHFITDILPECGHVQPPEYDLGRGTTLTNHFALDTTLTTSRLGLGLPPFKFNLLVPWIAHLRILELLTREIDTLKALNAIKQMPHLQHLSLSGMVPHPDFEPPEPESIVLSNLTYLRVEFENAMTFALGIKPAAYCVLTMKSQIGRQQVDLSADFIALTRIVSRYGQPYFSSRTGNALSLVVTIFQNYFEFHVVQADDHLPSSSAPIVNTGFAASSVFHVSLQSFISFTPNSSGLITPFLLCDLSSVKELELLLESPVWGLDPFFRALSDVQILWADSLGLDTLMLNEELSSEASFAKFYNKRKARPFLPLLTLDLGNDPRDDFAFWEGTSGLRITWQENGNRSEYICGSGGGEYWIFHEI